MIYPTCNFPMISVVELYDLIIHKIENTKPFSFIRLGDGEGVLLSIDQQSHDIDFSYLSGHLGFNDFFCDKLSILKNNMVEAIQKADVIGVRDDIVDVEFAETNYQLSSEQFIEKFQKNFKVRDCEKKLGYLDSRRIALLHRSVKSLDLDEKIQYCSAWAHYELHLSGGIFKILQRQKKIGLISSRIELPSLLSEIFNINVDFWGIPDMYRDLKQKQSFPQYIQRLEELLSKQLVEFPGMLFLVGGGFYGKLYCDLIKSQGGIALDIGSLLDAWSGLHTRPAVYSTLTQASYDGCSIPDEFLLSAGSVRHMVNLNE